MPLLKPSIVLRKAHGQNRSLLTRLLPVAGDVQSARHELRWLLEDCQKRVPVPEQQSLLEQYVTRRCTGEPLQYILGSVYFGELEIKCRPNVFIPRPETAAAVSFLVQSLISAKIRRAKLVPKAGSCGGNGDAERKQRVSGALRVFDLCSGSGCIPLLFWYQYYLSALEVGLSVPRLELVGFDMSQDALDLARENQSNLQSQQSELGKDWQHALRSLQQLKFIQANVLRGNNSTKELQQLSTLRQAIGWHVAERTGKMAVSKQVLDTDIWISNPPYISPESYMKNTSQSVRDFEPKAALMPPLASTTKTKADPLTGNIGDRFHQDILSQAMEMRPKVVLLEVEDLDQATRVAKMAVKQTHWHSVEIWRDIPTNERHVDHLFMERKIVTVRGSGEARSVLVCTRNGADLIGRHPPTRDEKREIRSQQKVAKWRQVKAKLERQGKAKLKSQIRTKREGRDQGKDDVHTPTTTQKKVR